ncbi:MAG: hypothetical protein SF123_19615 [Chloroflexota bacterium]|nr:hypothetical protein [Chloroflexota bacterium]
MSEEQGRKPDDEQLYHIANACFEAYCTVIRPLMGGKAIEPLRSSESLVKAAWNAVALAVVELYGTPAAAPPAAPQIEAAMRLYHEWTKGKHGTFSLHMTDTGVYVSVEPEQPDWGY